LRKRYGATKIQKPSTEKLPELLGNSFLTNTIDRLILPNSKHKDPHTPT
jgi:hypothetical protein